ncbi:MAG TPA: hypothetical protein VGL63_09465 [Streptosporangiaceae bacterium]
MSILKRFWRPAAVVACVAGMFLGTATAANAATQGVSPRNSCGGFNGNIQWDEDPLSMAGDIHIWGELWNNHCPGGSTYLLVAYTLQPGAQYEFFPIKSAGYSSTGNVGVNWSNGKSNQNFTGISVRVCNTSGGGGCGSPVGV